ncbi:MAG: alpha/beta hydrolase [Clostridiales bacterium]|jgi:acetyl esterase/lipase|nr:alpha/beta hydrolase [Clostridiales bacterium]
MKTETLKLTNENVTLTTYILDSSAEMPNMKTRPAILICPGGGYYMCSDREAEPIAMAFLAMGYNAFVLRYSLKEASEFPRPLNDAEQALALIRERSAEWGVIPEKIAVCGFSAGGHLAAALGTMGKIRPNAMILGYPCITEDICNSKTLATHVPSLDTEVDEQTPPAFIFSTADDSCVPIRSSLSFASALSEKKIPFELHVFGSGSHGLAVAKRVTGAVNPEVSDWIPMCEKWLDKLFFE